MSYLVTKERAQQVLGAIKVNPTYANFADKFGMSLPYPAIKRVDDPYFNRDGQATDAYYLVWPNGFHVPVAEADALMQFAPGNWPRMLLVDYAMWADGHQQPMPGTEDGIKWKD